MTKRGHRAKEHATEIRNYRQAHEVEFGMQRAHLREEQAQHAQREAKKHLTNPGESGRKDGN